MFKIDLIVWKFAEHNEVTSKYEKFKIDLIVWKLSELRKLEA